MRIGPGLSSGLLRGFAVGEQMMRNRETDERIRKLDERNDVAYNRAEEERQVIEGMRKAGADAFNGGYDVRGYPARESAPGEAEGPTTPNPGMSVVTQVDQRTPEQKGLDAYAASENFALQRGRFDLARDAHIRGEQLADQYRDRDYARSWAEYNATQNPEVLMSHVKRFVRDGMDFNKPEITMVEVRRPDGGIEQQPRIVVSGTRTAPDGTKSEFKSDPMTKQQFEQMAYAYTNPERARAASAARAQAFEKAQMEIAVKQAEKGPVQSEPGKTLFDPASGTYSTVPGTKFEKVGEGENQRLVAITYGKDGRTVQSDMTGLQNTIGNFTQHETKRYDSARDSISKLIQDRMTQGVGSEELSRLQQAALSHASDLVAANRGNGVNLEAGKLADYAMQIAEGKQQLVKVPVIVGGREIGKATGFMVDGKPVFTNPQEVRALEAKIGQAANAVATSPATAERPIRGAGEKGPGQPQGPSMRNAPPKSGPDPQILAQEVDAERAKLAELQGMTEEQYRTKYGTNAEPRENAIVRAQDNIAALAREKAPGTTPAEGAKKPETAPRAVPSDSMASAAPTKAAARAAMTIMPPEERNAKVAQLQAEADRHTATLNSRSSSPKQIADAREALRGIRSQMAELAGTTSPEAARLQSVILDPRSSPSDVQKARMGLRDLRARNNGTGNLPMTQ